MVEQLASEAGWNANLTNGKSVDDPCPPGYRVPASTVWNGSATHENADLLDIADLGTSKAYRYWNYGTTGLLNRGDDVYYPYSGYVEGATLKTGQGGKTVNDGVAGFTYQYNVPPLGSVSVTDYYLMQVWEPREYRNVTYSYVENENDGYLWSLDRNNTFFYKYIESSTSINCEVRVATVQWETKKVFGVVYSATCKSISWGSWSSMSNIATTVGGYSDLNTAVNNDIDSKGHRSEPIQHDDEYTPPQNYGLQVRCERE